MQAGGWGDTLYIPRLDHADPMLNNPVGWLRDKMEQYISREDE